MGSTAAPRDVVLEDVSVSLAGQKVLADVSLVARGGQTLALLGPSGCGKTTLLRVLAGLQPTDAGSVRLGEQLVNNGKVHLAAEQRGVGMVFQDFALFPHLSVASNVAFGLPRRERRQAGNGRVTELLDMLNIAELSQRLPGSLSGGQRQRVALARALAPRPSVLLLDEPFSSLDTALRTEVRAEVAVLLRELGITCVFVTHDQEEAFALGDEVAVMRDGAVVQQAAPDELYDHPADPWVAHFVGEADILAGFADGAKAHTSLGAVPLQETMSGAVDVVIRPQELLLSYNDGFDATSAEAGYDDGADATSAGTDASIVHIDFYGHDTLYHLNLGDGTMVRCRATGAPQHSVGAAVGVRHSGKPTVSYGKSRQ